MKYKGWLNKKDSNVEENTEEVIIPEEIKEEKEMGFFKKHLDKIVIGGLSGLALLVVGILIANKVDSDDVEESDDFDDEIEDQDILSEFNSDNVVNF